MTPWGRGRLLASDLLFSVSMQTVSGKVAIGTNCKNLTSFLRANSKMDPCNLPGCTVFENQLVKPNTGIGDFLAHTEGSAKFLASEISGKTPRVL